MSRPTVVCDACVLYPAPNDRHVLAAAIHCQADVIMTFNLAHFPEHELSKYGVNAQHPDDFVWQLLQIAPEVVCGAIQRQRANLKKPPKTVEEFLVVLQRQSLLQTVTSLSRLAPLI